MANYMYQNISEEMRQYHTSDGARRYVVPGDVFDSDIEQNSEFFKLVDQSSFISAEPVEEKREQKTKRR